MACFLTTEVANHTLKRSTYAVTAMRMMLPKRSPVHANACLAWIAATEGPHIATEDGQGGEGCRMETWLMGTERESRVNWREAGWRELSGNGDDLPQFLLR